MRNEERAKYRLSFLKEAEAEYETTGLTTKIDKLIQQMYSQMHFWRVQPLDAEFPTISFFLDEEPSLDKEKRDDQLRRVDLQFESEIKDIKVQAAAAMNAGFGEDSIQLRFWKQAYIFYKNVYSKKVFPDYIFGVVEQAQVCLNSIEEILRFLHAAKFLITHSIRDTGYENQLEIYNSLHEMYLYY